MTKKHVYQPVDDDLDISNPPQSNGAPDVEFLRAMQILRLEPGDIVVITVKQKLSNEAIKNLHQQLLNTFNGFGIEDRIMILDEGLEIGAIRCGPGSYETE